MFTTPRNRREGERLVIELGRALRKGEHKCKVFFMRLADCIAPDFKTLQPVCDYILCAGADVGSTKREIIAQLASTDPKYSSLAFDSCRLRMKSCRSPMDVYTDEQKFGDNVQISPEVKMQRNFHSGAIMLTVCLAVSHSTSCKNAMRPRSRTPIRTTRSCL